MLFPKFNVCSSQIYHYIYANYRPFDGIKRVTHVPVDTVISWYINALWLFSKFLSNIRCIKILMWSRSTLLISKRCFRITRYIISPSSARSKIVRNKYFNIMSIVALPLALLGDLQQCYWEGWINGCSFSIEDDSIYLWRYHYLIPSVFVKMGPRCAFS